MAIPVASYGTNEKVAEDLQTALQPEYDSMLMCPSDSTYRQLLTIIPVVHVAFTTEAALAELPALAAGNTDTVPSSGIGSNASAEPGARKVPKALIIGGNVSAEEAAEVKAAVAAAAPDLKPITITQEDVEAVANPSTENIAAILKAKLAEAGI